jgi:restriction endonuclease Mrr
MAVPDFQTLFRPLLEVLADDEDHRLSDPRDRLAHLFSLSDEELQETILYPTRLIDRLPTAAYRINDRGRRGQLVGPYR